MIVMGDELHLKESLQLYQMDEDQYPFDIKVGDYMVVFLAQLHYSLMTFELNYLIHYQYLKKKRVKA